MSVDILLRGGRVVDPHRRVRRRSRPPHPRRADCFARAGVRAERRHGDRRERAGDRARFHRSAHAPARARIRGQRVHRHGDSRRRAGRLHDPLLHAQHPPSHRQRDRRRVHRGPSARGGANPRPPLRRRLPRPRGARAHRHGGDGPGRRSRIHRRRQSRRHGAPDADGAAVRGPARPARHGPLRGLLHRPRARRPRGLGVVAARPCRLPFRCRGVDRLARHRARRVDRRDMCISRTSAPPAAPSRSAGPRSAAYA